MLSFDEERVQCFNSTLVRFKRVLRVCRGCQDRRFNSTLVRFKLLSHKYHPWNRFQFQFHSGSIQTVLTANFRFEEQGFNSTLVRFKRVGHDRYARFPSNSFNSTLVRFKLVWKLLSITKVELFQFHSGSIQTLQRVLLFRKSRRFNSTLVRFKLQGVSNPSSTDPCFNSTLVRFKRYQGSCLRPEINVSIPLWFDSNMSSLNCLPSRRLVSIPLWFDSNRRINKMNILLKWFQFHSGSIQTTKLLVKSKAFLWFQFHSGSIQTRGDLLVEHWEV